MITLTNVALSQYASLRVGGLASKLIVVETGDDITEVVASVKSEGSIWVLGFGTNCLISDQGLPGTVIINHAGGIEQLANNRLKVQSGTNWDEFVLYTVNNQLWGLEFTSGIPGGVGAAVVGNIAAYGHKVADCFIEATILDVKAGTTSIWPKDSFEFSYRSSALQKAENSHLVVLEATFELSHEPTGQLEYGSVLKVAKTLGLVPDTLGNRRSIILETRQRAGSILQDTTAGPWTAGSFFKNPLIGEAQVQAIIAHDETGLTAEQLLRQNQIHGESNVRVSAAHVLLAAGFHRGQTWGQVRLHPEHILKIENIGGATAQQIYDVVQTIIATVKDKLGITLEPEVRCLGDF